MTTAKETLGIPTFGIQIKSKYGKTAWIDLEDTTANPQDVVDKLLGRDAYPETWNMERIISVSQTRGLGKRIAAYARDVEGPWIECIEDLMYALQSIISFNGLTSEQNKARFLRWLESESGCWWLPGCGCHVTEDVVHSFDIDIAFGLYSTDA